MKKIYTVSLLQFFIISVMIFVCNTVLFSQESVTYTILDLGTLGGLTSIPGGINDLGDAVGNSTTSNNLGHAFLYQNGVMTDIGTLGGESTTARGVNDAIQVVGGSRPQVGEPLHAFIYQNGVMTDLGTLGGNNSIAISINDLGNVVGEARLSSQLSHAFLYSNGVMNDLGTFGGEQSTAYSINNSNQVVGSASLPPPSPKTHAFLYENGVMTDINPPGYENSIAVDINDSGNVVGYDLTSSQGIFIYKNGVATILGQIGSPCAINNSDQIVGSFSAPPNHAFIWQDGVRSDLNDLVEPGSGWVISLAQDINDQGIILAEAYQTASQPHAILLIPNKLKITSPQAGELFIAGEQDTIKWTGGQAGQQLSIEYGTDNGNTYSLITIGREADSSYYAWDVPKELLSTKMKIKISDFNDPNINAESATFKSKPYIITRLDENNNYVAYNINTDQWGFSNKDIDVWPRIWFEQFNYQGIDPFTNQPFPHFTGFSIAPNSTHPDWKSWVNTFGINACYLDLPNAVYSVNALVYWQYFNGPWNGSCFGIAISNALAFQKKDDFLARYPTFPQSFISPINVNSDFNVIPVINELFTHQMGNPHYNYRNNVGIYKTPNQTLADIKSMLKEDNVQIRTLSLLSNDSADPGGHAILAYKVEQDPTFADEYNIYVYDNSYPDSLSAYIEIDTTLNYWTTYYAWTNWGGTKGLYLRDPAENYLTNAIILPKAGDYKSPLILSDSVLQVFVDDVESIILTNELGQSIGYFNGTLVTDIPGATPFIVDNGSTGPPKGYDLNTDNYSIKMNNFNEDTIGVALFNSNKSFVYERSGANLTDTDRLFFDLGLSAVNPDQQIKNINLTNIINETTQEKVFFLSELGLAQNDSVKIENPDSSKVKLISYGSAKDYDIDLNYATANGMGRFANSGVILTANTSHTFIPDWTDLTNSQLVVLVDIGNNGTIDDTLHLNNTVDVEDQGLMLSPNSYNLAQNYPNPFNPTTTVQYSIPQRSDVILKVYDVLGNEVVTLVNEEKPAGVYTINFDASQLASGIYLYRLQAGNFVETKKMILIK